MNKVEMALQSVDAFVGAVNTAQKNLRKEAERIEVRRYFGIVLNLVVVMWFFILTPLAVTFYMPGYEISPIPGAISVAGLIPAFFLRPGIDKIPIFVQMQKDFRLFGRAFRWLAIVSAGTSIFVFPLMITGQTLFAVLLTGVFTGCSFLNSILILYFRRKVLKKLA